MKSLPNNRFCYEISLTVGATYAQPDDVEVKARVAEYPEFSLDDARTELTLERFLDSLSSEFDTDEAMFESTLLEGGRLRVTLCVPVDEATADRFVSEHAKQLNFVCLKLSSGTVIHPFNKRTPGTTLH